MLFVDVVGWCGTILMFGGSILSIYKHKSCWILWILGGIAIIYQAAIQMNWNILILQVLYMPLNVWGIIEWRKDDEDS